MLINNKRLQHIGIKEKQLLFKSRVANNKLSLEFLFEVILYIDIQYIFFLKISSLNIRRPHKKKNGKFKKREWF